MKKYVISIQDAFNDRITKAQKQGRNLSALSPSQFIKHLVGIGLEEYEHECKVEQARIKARLQAAGCETAPEAAAVHGKIIPFPGVSLSDHFQNDINNFLLAMGYIE